MSNTWYIDLLQGNDSNNGLSFAQRMQTIETVIPLVRPGDLVLVMASPAAVDTGLTAAWANLSPSLTLSSAVALDLMVGTWYGSSSSSLTLDTAIRKSPVQSASLSIPASTTGKVGFITESASHSTAGYQQVSFWFCSDTPLNAGDMTLNICGDTLGNSGVYKVTLPAIPVANQWMPITVDFGTPMVGSIGSVGLILNTAQDDVMQVWVDNVVACLPSSSSQAITHQTLLGNPNSTGVGDGSDGWYTVGYLSGATVLLDQSPNTPASSYTGYAGTTGTKELWTRTAFLSLPGINPQTPTYEFYQDGLIDQIIEWRFGMDRNSMTDQVDETWFSGQSGAGVGFKIGCDFNKISGLSLARYYYGLWLTGSHGGSFGLIGCISSDVTNVMLDHTTTSTTIHVVHNHRSRGSGFNDQPNGGQNNLRFDYLRSNLGYGVEIAANDLLHDSTIINNGSAGIHTSGAVRIYRTTTAGNGSSTTAGTAGTGLQATYYSKWEFQGTTFSRIDPNIAFSWTPTIPIPGFPATYWNIRWVGWITPRYSEPYTFTVVVDDGARIWIDDVLILDNWVTDHNHVFDSVTVNLTANVPHKFVCEYRQGPLQYANIYVEWSSPSQAQEVIPPDRFSVNKPGTIALEVASDNTAGYDVDLHDCMLGESLEFTGLSDYYNIRVRSHNHMGTKGNHLMVTDGGQVISENGTDRHTLTGLAWRMMPTAPRGLLYPLDYKIASLAVVANKAATVTGYFKRSNAAVTGQLLIPGGQLDGVPNDLIATSSITGSYEQLSLTFTPTEMGIIDVYARAFGNSPDATSSSVWIDDMAVSQH